MDDERKKDLLKALNRFGVATQDELQASLLLPSPELLKGLQDLNDEGLIKRDPGAFPEFGGMVELTVKGLRKART